MRNTDEVRQYARDRGIAYDNITSGDICTLVMILNKHIKQACKKNGMSVNTMRMSEKIDSKYAISGKLIQCYLYINSHYFTRRDCIYFNKGGQISFCSWADDENMQVITDAFIEWCDEVSK